MPNPLTLPQILPDGTTNVKFMQFYVTPARSKIITLPLLRVSFDPEDRHGAILREALDSLGFTWKVSEKEHLAQYNFPADASNKYKLVGAGRANYMGGEFLAWGASFDYNIFPNEEHFQKLQRLNPDFRFKIDMTRR